MVQYLEVPKTPLIFTTSNNNNNISNPNYNYNLNNTSINNKNKMASSSNTRSLINGFYSSSARNSRDVANLSSYTRRSNSDYALPRICQPTPIATTPPSFKRRFARIATPIGDALPSDDRNHHGYDQHSTSAQTFHSERRHERLFSGDRKTYLVYQRGMQIFAAEFLGTAMLMYVGCAWQSSYHAWTFSISTMIAIHCFGAISGAHVNPGATIVAYIMGQVPQISLVPIYWLAQFLGGLLGYMLHFEVTLLDKDEKSMCLTKPPLNGSTAKTFALEAIMSFIFFIAIAALFDPKNKFARDTACLKIGFILYGMLYSMSGIIPLSLNTARSLPPSIFLGDFEGQWIYWIAPNVAAVLAGGIYRIIFGSRPEPELQGDKDMS